MKPMKNQTSVSTSVDQKTMVDIFLRELPLRLRKGSCETSIPAPQ